MATRTFLFDYCQVDVNVGATGYAAFTAPIVGVPIFNIVPPVRISDGERYRLHMETAAMCAQAGNTAEQTRQMALATAAPWNERWIKV